MGGYSDNIFFIISQPLFIQEIWRNVNIILLIIKYTRDQAPQKAFEVQFTHGMLQHSTSAYHRHLYFDVEFIDEIK